MNIEIINILDRSGSMAPLRLDVIGGYNRFIDEQKALPGQARVTLVQFNGKVDLVYRALPIEYVPPLTDASFIPMGSTALLDAIGTTLEQQGRRIAEQRWAEKVLVNISTDGEENVSTAYTLEQVKQMITHAQDQAGWVFLFQAANQDAFAAGHKYGISGATTYAFSANAAGVREVYGTMNSVATSLRTGS